MAIKMAVAAKLRSAGQPRRLTLHEFSRLEVSHADPVTLAAEALLLQYC
jgi:hypothetical protein